jgi:pilus assembly protein CpaE
MDNHLLRAIVIAPDEYLRITLERRAADSGRVVVLKTLDRYPELKEAAAIVRAHAAHVVFMEIASNPLVIGLASELQSAVPGLRIVAVHYSDGLTGERLQQVLMDLLHGGVRELLCDPFDETAFVQAVERISKNIRDVGQVPESGEIYAFLPAKGGTGASTIAVNTALALGRLEEGKTLLADCDLNCGVVRFQLKLQNPFSIQDALEKGATLDDGVWPDLAARAEQVEGDALYVLASGGIVPRYPYPATHALSLIEFARRRYRRVILDLSDHLDQFEVDMLSQCRRIYLVVQPDLSAVHLAREKIRFLKSIDLDDRVELLVSQWRKDAVLTLADIESILGIPITQSLSSDRKGIYQALLSGTGVDPVSAFGREVQSLATAISEAAEKPATAREAVRKRRIEFFSVLPGKYSLFPSQR